MDTHLLSYYEAIERLSEEMLKAATLKDWKQVIKIEATCRALLLDLREALEGKTVDEETIQARMAIISRIAKNDAAARLASVDFLPGGSSHAIH